MPETHCKWLDDTELDHCNSRKAPAAGIPVYLVEDDQAQPKRIRATTFGLHGHWRWYRGPDVRRAWNKLAHVPNALASPKQLLRGNSLAPSTPEGRDRECQVMSG